MRHSLSEQLVVEVMNSFNDDGSVNRERLLRNFGDVIHEYYQQPTREKVAELLYDLRFPGDDLWSNITELQQAYLKYADAVLVLFKRNNS